MRALGPVLATVLSVASIATAAPSEGEAHRSVASGPITINDRAPATPYPSEIEVSGVGAAVQDVNVALRGLDHGYPDDLDVVLEGPGGASTFLLSDVGSNDPIEGVTLDLDDEAAGQLPDETTMTSGMFRPTDSDSIGWEPDEMPAPATTPPVASLAVFDGTKPNGTWRLFVYDDTTGEHGVLEDWSLEVQTLDVSRAKAREGKSARFRVTRSGNMEAPFTASYKTANGSAKGGKDFKRASGMLTFAPGQATTSVKVKIRDDRVEERKERFALEVTSEGATVRGHARIRDNDT